MLFFRMPLRGIYSLSKLYTLNVCTVSSVLYVPMFPSCVNAFWIYCEGGTLYVRAWIFHLESIPSTAAARQLVAEIRTKFQPLQTFLVSRQFAYRRRELKNIYRNNPWKTYSPSWNPSPWCTVNINPTFSEFLLWVITKSLPSIFKTF